MKDLSTEAGRGRHGSGDASCSALDQLYWERPCSAVARRSGLTPRETDVLEQLARGRDLLYIEDRLCLSRNTVKTYVKRVYTKTGVHGKQELIDLVDAERKRSGSGDPASPR